MEKNLRYTFRYKLFSEIYLTSFIEDTLLSPLYTLGTLIIDCCSFTKLCLTLCDPMDYST